jgi:hypothetical protein
MTTKKPSEIIREKADAFAEANSRVFTRDEDHWSALLEYLDELVERLEKRE